MWDAIRNRELKEEEGGAVHVGGTARCLCYANANPLSLRLEPCSRPGRACCRRGDGAYYSSSSMSNVPG